MTPQEYVHKYLTISEKNAIKLTWFCEHLKQYAKRYHAKQIGEIEPDFQIEPPQILKMVSTALKIPIDDLQLRSRIRPYVIARQVYCYYSFKKTNWSLAKIGAEINRDHATVLHSIRTITNIVNYPSSDPDASRIIQYFEDIINVHPDKLRKYGNPTKADKLKMSDLLG